MSEPEQVEKRKRPKVRYFIKTEVINGKVTEVKVYPSQFEKYKRTTMEVRLMGGVFS